MPRPRRCSDCFTNVPDFTPYSVMPNNVALDQMNPARKKNISDAALRKDAYVSARLPLQKARPMPG